MAKRALKIRALSLEDNNKVQEAIGILQKQYKRTGFITTSPEDTKRYFMLNLAHHEHEVFGVMLLDNKHRLIEFKEMFRGTIDNASVYPREVVKEALASNAAAVVFTHNHPSGDPEPSAADRAITAKLKAALALVDVRVLDHIVVGNDRCVSFAELGIM